MRLLASAPNALGTNGFINNGLIYHGDLDTASPTAWNNTWNAMFLPTFFTEKILGENWLNPQFLGAKGVGNLSQFLKVKENTLDNRHIHSGIKEWICMENKDGSNETQAAAASFREYFQALIDLAWPKNAALNICCAMPTGQQATSPCVDPDYTFLANANHPEMEPLALAPHFLTELFEPGQQEALTAGLIAKINVHGIQLKMDLAGRFDLGAAGTKLITREDPKTFHYALGSAWGNMFLDCLGADRNKTLCEESFVQGASIGRNSLFQATPMFTCSGKSSYPTDVSGKSCFSKDMATNTANGCDLVAAVGSCDEVCVGGYCGARIPPMEGKGTSNVLYVYMSEFSKTEQKESDAEKFLPLYIIMLLVVIVVVGTVVLRTMRARTTARAPAAGNTTTKQEEDMPESDIETVDSHDMEQIGSRVIAH